MLFLLLLLLLLVLGSRQTTLPANFTNSVLNVSSVLDFAQGVTLLNPNATTYVQMETTDFFVSRLTNNGKLQIFDIATGVFKYNFFASRNYPSSRPVISYDLIDNETTYLSILSDDNQAYLYNLSTNGTANLFYTSDVATPSVNSRWATQMLKDQFILCILNTGNAGISRRKQSQGWALSYPFPANFYAINYNMKVCKANQNDAFFRVAMWKRNCYVFVLKCPVTAACTQEFVFNNTACILSEWNSTVRDYYKLSWSSNCTKIFFQSKGQGLRMVNLAKNTTLTTFPVTVTGASLSGFWLIDNFDQFLGVYKPNGTFQIYNMSTQTLINSYNLAASSVVAYNRVKQKLYVTDGEKLLNYQFACNYPNYSLDASGLCIFNTSYVAPPPPQNDSNTGNPPATNGSNTTPTNGSNTTPTNGSNTTPINNTQTNPSPTPTNQTNQSSTDSGPSMDDILDEALNNAMNKILSNSTLQGQIKDGIKQMNSTLQRDSPMLQYVDKKMNEDTPTGRTLRSMSSVVATYLPAFVEQTTYLLKTIPVNFLLMGYMNFWVICSMYLIALIDLPHVLREYLLKIYTMISSSLFENIGIEMNLDNFFTEKFQEDSLQGYLKYGFSSDVILSNLQTLIILLCSYLVLGLFCIIISYLPDTNFLKRKLKDFNYKIAFLGQFVAVMNNFFFNLPIITENAFQDQFREKINMTIQNFFFVFSIFISCIVFLQISKQNQNTKNKKESRIERLGWFFDTQCNCLLPIVVMFKIIPLFLLFNMFFFCIPIYIAWMEKKCRVIAIIKSLYFQLFNTGIILIVIFNTFFQDSRQFYDYLVIVTMVTSFIIIIGAIHQILQLIVSFLKTILSVTCFIRHKISNVTDAEQVKQIAEHKDLINVGKNKQESAKNGDKKEVHHFIFGKKIKPGQNFQQEKVTPGKTSEKKRVSNFCLQISKRSFKSHKQNSTEGKKKANLIVKSVQKGSQMFNISNHKVSIFQATTEETFGTSGKTNVSFIDKQRILRVNSDFLEEIPLNISSKPYSKSHKNNKQQVHSETQKLHQREDSGVQFVNRTNFETEPSQKREVQTNKKHRKQAKNNRRH